MHHHNVSAVSQMCKLNRIHFIHNSLIGFIFLQQMIGTLSKTTVCSVVHEKGQKAVSGI